jgi:hypothetical protein
MKLAGSPGMTSIRAKITTLATTRLRLSDRALMAM